MERNGKEFFLFYSHLVHNNLVNESVTLIFHHQSDSEFQIQQTLKDAMEMDLKSKLKENVKKIEENMKIFKKIQNTKENQKVEKVEIPNETKIKKFLNFFQNETEFDFQDLKHEPTVRYLIENSKLTSKLNDQTVKTNSVKEWNKLITRREDESEFQKFLSEVFINVQGSKNNFKNSILQIRKKYQKSPEIIETLTSICSVNYERYSLRYLDFDVFIQEILINDEFLDEIIHISNYCPTWNIDCKHLKEDEILFSLFEIDEIIHESREKRRKNLLKQIEKGYNLFDNFSFFNTTRSCKIEDFFNNINLEKYI
jgi:hypothetical protein